MYKTASASSSANPSQFIQNENKNPLKNSRARKETLHWKKHDSSLITDIRGRIKGCGDRASKLLCRQPDKLSGLSLDTIIPQLPLSPNTPFYNLAYAVFQSGTGLPMQRTIQTDEGRNIPLDISLSVTVVKGRHLIALTLNPSNSFIQFEKSKKKNNQF